MKRIITFLGFLIVLLFIAGCSKSNDTTITGNAVKEFDTVISNFKYSPESITVNQGDIVRINIRNNDGLRHGIFIDAFGINDFVNPGQVKSIQFVAAKKVNTNTFCSTDHGEKLYIKVV